MQLAWHEQKLLEKVLQKIILDIIFKINPSAAWEKKNYNTILARWCYYCFFRSKSFDLLLSKIVDQFTTCLNFLWNNPKLVNRTINSLTWLTVQRQKQREASETSIFYLSGSYPKVFDVAFWSLIWFCLKNILNETHFCSCPRNLGETLLEAEKSAFSCICDSLVSYDLLAGFLIKWFSNGLNWRNKKYFETIASNEKKMFSGKCFALCVITYKNMLMLFCWLWCFEFTFCKVWILIYFIAL